VTAGVFDAADPRSALSAVASAAPAPAAYPAEFVSFRDHEPAWRSEGGQGWFARGQNFVIGCLEVRGCSTLTGVHPDEWMLLLPEAGLRGELRAGSSRHGLPASTITVLPEGESSVRLEGSGSAIVVTTSRDTEWARLAINADHYAEPRPGVAPFHPWPRPVGGVRPRVYGLDVPAEQGRFGRIWRCSSLMVNVLDPLNGPRDPRKLSPHSHDDFEQGSLAISGEYVHHLRWSWGPDRTLWREDQHKRLPSPSLAVIPPPAIHTSEAVAPGLNQLIDVFSPPRLDFSLQDGWVLNAADYPLPDDPTRPPTR
jgi:hypothetical protein